MITLGALIKTEVGLRKGISGIFHSEEYIVFDSSAE
jgi:hypothetical protein